MNLLQEPLEIEFPTYVEKSGKHKHSHHLPCFEDIHYMWRQLPAELKCKNIPIPNETNTQRMERILNNVNNIYIAYHKYNEIKNIIQTK